MAQQPIDEAAILRARGRIVALGALLAEVTDQRAAGDVHRVLLDRLAESGHDPRIDGVPADRWCFVDGWEALRRGTALPATDWESLVLPAVVAFSGAEAQKVHLEMAAHRWLAARSAVDAVADYSWIITTVIERGASRQRQPGGSHDVLPVAAVLGAVRRIPAAGPAPVGRSSARPWLIRGLVSGAAVAVTVAAVTVSYNVPAPTGGHSWLSPVIQPSGPRLAPAVSLTTGPGATPMTPPASPGIDRPAAVEPVAVKPPVPSVVPDGGGPAVAPSPPSRLAIVGTTPNSVSLTWYPPADGGTVGVAYYRVECNGVDAGWTTGLSAVITGLNPGVGYMFVVRALNRAGQESGSSIAVTASADPYPSGR